MQFKYFNVLGHRQIRLNMELTFPFFPKMKNLQLLQTQINFRAFESENVQAIKIQNKNKTFKACGSNNILSQGFDLLQEVTLEHSEKLTVER